MKKAALICLMVNVILFLVACENKQKSNMQKETTEETITNTSNDEENEYDIYFNDKYLWDVEDPFTMEYKEVGNRVYELDLYTELEKNENNDKLYAIRIGPSFGGEDVDFIKTKEFFDNYIKVLDIKNNYSKKTDEEIYKIINENGMMDFVFLLTKDEIINIKLPEDIKVIFWWEEKGNVELTKEGIEYYTNKYGESKLPVRYYNEKQKSEVIEYVTVEYALKFLEENEKKNELTKKYMYWCWELVNDD